MLLSLFPSWKDCTASSEAAFTSCWSAPRSFEDFLSAGWNDMTNTGLLLVFVSGEESEILDAKEKEGCLSLAFSNADSEGH